MTPAQSVVDRSGYWVVAGVTWVATSIAFYYWTNGKLEAWGDVTEALIPLLSMLPLIANHFSLLEGGGEAQFVALLYAKAFLEVSFTSIIFLIMQVRLRRNFASLSPAMSKKDLVTCILVLAIVFWVFFLVPLLGRLTFPNGDMRFQLSKRSYNFYFESNLSKYLIVEAWLFAGTYAFTVIAAICALRWSTRFRS